MNLRNIPFLRLLLPFLAGLALGGWLDRPLPGLGWALTLGTGLVLLLANRGYAHGRRWQFGLAVYGVLLLAGYAHIVWHNELLRPDHFAHRIQKPLVFVGTVYDAPAKGARLKVPLHIEAAGATADSLRACSGNVLLFLEIDSSNLSIRYGDRLAVRAQVRPTEPPKNPHVFDYRRYLHFQNIHYQAFVRPDSLRVLSVGHGHAVWRAAFFCRERLLGLLRAHFPTTDEYAVASALLVGYKDDLSDDLRAAYTETGSMHALAVSGTHVGFLYVGLLLALKRLRWRGALGRWTQTVVILLAIWAFTFLTGATASVLRASVMFSTFLLGRGLYRDASIWNILAGSAFGLLLLNPYFLFDAGFQLSYAAVGGMVFFYPRLQKLAPARLPYGLGEGWKVLLIGVAAQLGTLPLSLYYFHQFPCYFWLAGWVVVLGGAVFLWGGAFLVFLDWLSPTLAGWLGQALYGLVWGMNRLILGIQELPGSVISGVWLPGWAAAVSYACLGTFAAALLTRRAGWLLACLGLFFSLGAARAWRAFGRLEQGQVAVYHLNKQQLVDFFDGEKCVSLADSATPRQILFTAQANRWSAGIRADSAVGRGAGFQRSNLFVQPPFIQFFQQKIALIDDARWVETGRPPPVPVDVLVLSRNAPVKIADCLRRFPCRLVVLDASNSWKRAEQWKTECRTLGLSCHDVREQGAWVWSR